MSSIYKVLGLLMLLCSSLAPAYAETTALKEHVLGKADAPITVEEYASLTCSHCGDFANTVLPELEKRYIDTGKVRFIFRDFPLDGVALKAATLAHCMPEGQYYPFIKVLFKNQMSWITADGGPEKVLIQYAQLGGLDEEKAKACLNDTKLQDAVVASRTEGTEKYKIEATPSFVINKGQETLKGGQSVESFSATFDRLLAKKQ